MNNLELLTEYLKYMNSTGIQYILFYIVPGPLDV